MRTIVLERPDVDIHHGIDAIATDVHAHADEPARDAAVYAGIVGDHAGICDKVATLR